MRLIELGDDYDKAKARFGIFYSAVTQGGAPKDLAGLRNLTKVQDALEAISHPKTESVGNGQTVETRELNEGVEQFRLEDAQYDLLKNRIFGSEIPWVAAAARRVDDAYTALEEAKEEKNV